MLDMKCAPMDGTWITIFRGGLPEAVQWATKPGPGRAIAGWFNRAGSRAPYDVEGWWPIGNAWLDPAAAPPPPRNQSFAGLVGTGVSGPAIVAWDIVRGEWYDHSTGSTVTLRGWLQLPGEDNT